MLCKYPVQVVSGEFVGCGRCLNCRINRKREWQHRLMLEDLSHKYSCFVTLTYDEMFAPVDPVVIKGKRYAGWSVNPRALVLFLKRLRKALEPRRIRYFAVGEYGEKKGRPHYHLVLFNVHFLESEVIESAWGCGDVHVGELNSHSAGYICGYVAKGLTRETDYCMDRLGGRYPEFSRMSNRPGIGAIAIDEMARKFAKSGVDAGRFVQRLVSGRAAFLLGRYLIGRFNRERKVSVREQMAAEREGFMDRWRDLICSRIRSPGEHTSRYSHLVAKNEGKRRRVEDNFKLFKKGRCLL